VTHFASPGLPLDKRR